MERSKGRDEEENMKSYVAFDLEIAYDFPPEGEPMDYAALGISSAAIAWRPPEGEIKYETWTGTALAMSGAEARSLVTDLLSLEQEGKTQTGEQTVPGRQGSQRRIPVSSGRCGRAVRYRHIGWRYTGSQQDEQERKRTAGIRDSRLREETYTHLPGPRAGLVRKGTHPRETGKRAVDPGRTLHLRDVSPPKEDKILDMADEQRKADPRQARR
jgi:hypothetical protein